MDHFVRAFVEVGLSLILRTLAQVLLQTQRYRWLLVVVYVRWRVAAWAEVGRWFDLVAITETIFYKEGQHLIVKLHFLMLYQGDDIIRCSSLKRLPWDWIVIFDVIWGWWYVQAWGLLAWYISTRTHWFEDWRSGAIDASLDLFRFVFVLIGSGTWVLDNRRWSVVKFTIVSRAESCSHRPTKVFLLYIARFSVSAGSKMLFFIWFDFV